MVEKYTKAIMAGIVGGVALVVLMMGTLLLGQPDINSLTLESLGEAVVRIIIILFIIAILNILIPLLIGVFAVRMAVSDLRDSRESFAVSMLAGALAGLIYIGILMILSNVTGALNTGSAVSSSASSGVSGIIGQAICCLPVTVIYCAVMAMIGGALYIAYYPFYPRRTQ